MRASENLSDWAAPADDELPRRLRRLGWSQTDAELRERCWEDFKRLMAARPDPSPVVTRYTDRLPASSDRYDCTRRAAPGRLAAAQAWHRLHSPSVVLGRPAMAR